MKQINNRRLHKMNKSSKIYLNQSWQQMQSRNLIGYSKWRRSYPLNKQLLMNKFMRTYLNQAPSISRWHRVKRWSWAILITQQCNIGNKKKMLIKVSSNNLQQSQQMFKRGYLQDKGRRLKGRKRTSYHKTKNTKSNSKSLRIVMKVMVQARLPLIIVRI